MMNFRSAEFRYFRQIPSLSKGKAFIYASYNWSDSYKVVTLLHLAVSPGTLELHARFLRTVDLANY